MKKQENRRGRGLLREVLKNTLEKKDKMKDREKRKRKVSNERECLRNHSVVCDLQRRV